MGLIEEVVTEPMLQIDPLPLSKTIADAVWTQDNGGVERHFFRDDFTNNTIAQYTLVGTPTIANGVMTLADGQKASRTIDAGAVNGRWEAVVAFATTWAADQTARLWIGANSYVEVVRKTGNVIWVAMYVNGTTILASTTTSATLADAVYGCVTVDCTGLSYAVKWNGVTIATALGTALTTPSIGVSVSAATATVESIAYIPTVSYTEPFTDATRYAAGVYPTDPIALYTFDETRNLLKYSQQMDIAAWSKQAGGTGSTPVVTANAATAPDGTQTADRIVFDKGAGTGTTDKSILFQAVSTLPVAILPIRSIWLKSNTGSSQNVILYDSSSGASLGQVLVVTTTWTRFTLSGGSCLAPTISLGTRGGTGYSSGGDQTLDILVWGAQIEAPPQSTVNLLKYTQEFDNAAWVTGGTTVTANAATAPDGTLTADALFEDNTTNWHSLTQTVSYVNGVGYVASIYAKPINCPTMQLSVKTATTTWSGTDINFANVTATGRGTIIPLPNGWFRISVSFTAASDYAGNVQVYPNVNGSFTGDPTQGLYLWGAQLEVGSSPTMYECHPNLSGPGAYFPTTDKQLLVDSARPRINLLLPNQANACEDGTITNSFAALNTATVSASTEHPFTGTYSCKVVTANTAALEGVNTGAPVCCDPSTVHSASAYVYGLSGTVKIRLFEYTINNGYIKGTDGETITLDGTEKRIAVNNVTVGPTTEMIRVSVQTNVQQGITFYVDKLQIQRGPMTTDWQVPPNIGLLGGSYTANTNTPTWTPTGLYFTTDDFVALPAMLAGKTAATVMVVANVITPVINAGIFSMASVLDANWSLDIRDYNGGTNNANVAVSSGAASVGLLVPQALATTYDAIICRFKGGVELSGQHNLGTKQSLTTSIPSVLNPSSTALHMLGRRSSAYLTGNISYVAIWDRALSDVEVAQKYAEIRTRLIRKGVLLS